ncbi:hypothetical protein [Chitinimonas naiadis]
MMRYPLPLLLLATCLGCALPAVGAEPKDSTQEALTTLRQTIGKASCQTDSQCRTVAAGAKSCGGPAFYLPWSTQDGDEQKILAQAQQYSQLRAAQAKRVGEMSTCQLVSDPGAVCQANVCVLRPRSDAMGGKDPT